jgi:hypothetical protein
MNDKKQRVDFDEWYAQQVLEIDQMPIVLVRCRREKLKLDLKGVHELMREDGIKDSRRKYLKGRRKFLTNLITHTNERIKLFNLVTHNGVTKNFAVHFVQVAADQLPQAEFQRIYGLCVMDAAEIESSIEAIADFARQAKDKLNLNGNGLVAPDRGSN